ncbi:MAG TPA: DUF4222 domain-containing protein [Providencia sp.]|uniref:DUF4222 domain-containing protein n=1 Tax=Providencia sp. TaxID=589 RepID=UPI000E91288A|nr:DUF4222 domain-containing protein [Providencia sp.]HBO25082.1 DUF4222 domain-containing protein [Providencia sp.]
MSNEKHKNLDRYFRDKRGRIVKVIEWDRQKQRVIFMLDDYEHPCFVPLSDFKKYYSEVK